MEQKKPQPSAPRLKLLAQKMEKYQVSYQELSQTIQESLKEKYNELVEPLKEKVSKAVAEVAKENAEAQKRTADSIGKEVASLKSLVTIAADTRRTYRERGDAVDELQKKFPTYFAAIDREAVLNGKVATATNLATYTDFKASPGFHVDDPVWQSRYAQEVREILQK
jgi:hypothetical protein